jgi:hypothetical protein
MSLADITDALQKISDFMQGINSFLAGIAFISETIGFGTVLLCIAVIVLSAGYSAVGLPKGKASFLAALITADSIWVMWEISFKAPAADCIFPLVRSNLIVLSPLAAVAILKRLAPSLVPKIKRIFPSLPRKKKHMDTHAFLSLYDEYQAQSAGLNRSMLDDILAARDGNRVSLSTETRMNIHKMKRTLEKFDSGDREL